MNPYQWKIRVPVILAAWAALLMGLAPHASAAPNIVFILADDLDSVNSQYWEKATSQGADDPLKKTKALLKSQGMTFVNAFAPTPICCPARSTILTGKLGHNTGVLTNGGDYGGWATFAANGNEEKTFAVWLQNAGYKTALIGKYMNGLDAEPYHIPPGWSEWYGFVGPHVWEYTGYNYDVNENGTINHYGLSAEDYSTDYVSRQAVDFIRRAEANDSQPFMLYVAPTAPHLPLPPAPRHSNNPYSNASPPSPPNYQEADLSDKSAWLRLTGAIRYAETAAWNPIDYRNRQGSLYALDDLVESVVNELATKGELSNTYIIFTSDNGYNLGAHRLIHKMAPYEESIRVPFVIRGPGVPAGSVRSEMALESDFAPTFAKLAGLSIPSDVDGRSLVPLFSGASVASWRSDFLVQYVSAGAANGIGAELPPAFWYLTGQELPTYRALRTKDYLYVEFYENEYAPNIHEYELYDLRSDPYQLNNLLSTFLGRWRYRYLTAQFDDRLDELESCTGANCR
ncbi:MAG: sulfatase [Bdellovibrionota bacterium]